MVPALFKIYVNIKIKQTSLLNYLLKDLRDMSKLNKQSPAVALTCELISRNSVTPEDKGCQQLIASYLASLGFKAEFMRFGNVDNLWLRKGTKEPLLVLAGHTDVVPSGPVSKWHFPPFIPTIKDGVLYGRGAVDMKGGLAAMVIAAQNFINRCPDHAGSIAFLITSDEEGPGINGTKKVVETLKLRNEIPQWCIIGEPSSSCEVGDTVKHGRRGTLTGCLTLHGTQGHVAYPHLADNPIHSAMTILGKLINEKWDNENKDFPATSFQIVHINSGAAISNIIPGHVTIQFNFRFSTEVTHQQLKQRVENFLNEHQLCYDIEWILSGLPFLTREGTLTSSVYKAIHTFTGKTPVFSTSGGTSDGRFIATMGTDVIEIGLCNKTIHQVNECTPVEDIEILTCIYEKILEELLYNELG